MTFATWLDPRDRLAMGLVRRLNKVRHAATFIRSIHDILGEIAATT